MNGEIDRATARNLRIIAFELQKRGDDCYEVLLKAADRIEELRVERDNLMNTHEYYMESARLLQSSLVARIRRLHDKLAPESGATCV